MSPLPLDDDELLAGARRGMGATAEDHARVKRKLFLQLGLGVGAATTALTTAGGASAGTGIATVTAAKIVAGIVIACSVVATSVALVRAPEKAPEVATTASAPHPVRAAHPGSIAAPPPPAPIDLAELPPIPSAVEAPTATPPAVGPAALGRKADAPLAAVSPPRAALSVAPRAPLVVAVMAAVVPEAPAPVAVPPSGPGEVGAEAQLLRDADAALRSGDGPRALALLDQHASRFPNGILVEERTAERVIVLCALGRTEDARKLGSAFLQDHPRSPLAARVRGSCAAP